MKYLKTKNSRRRGAAMELALMLFLAMTAVSILVVNTTMIQANKQKQSYKDLTEFVSDLEQKQFDQLGKYFINCILNEYDLYNNGLQDTTNDSEEGSEEMDFYCPKPIDIAEYIKQAFETQNNEESGLNYTYVVDPTAGEIGQNNSVYYTLKIFENGLDVYTITVRFDILIDADDKYHVTYEVTGIGKE